MGSGVSNSTRSWAPATGSVFPFIKPSCACSGELRSAIDETEGLKTHAHIRRHQPGPAVEASGQPFGFYPRQGHPVHSPLPSHVMWAHRLACGHMKGEDERIEGSIS